MRRRPRRALPWLPSLPAEGSASEAFGRLRVPLREWLHSRAPGPGGEPEEENSSSSACCTRRRRLHHQPGEKGGSAACKPSGCTAWAPAMALMLNSTYQGRGGDRAAGAFTRRAERKPRFGPLFFTLFFLSSFPQGGKPTDYSKPSRKGGCRRSTRCVPGLLGFGYLYLLDGWVSLVVLGSAPLPPWF